MSIDAGLVAAAQAGDKTAFAQLWDAALPTIRAVVLRRVGYNQWLADDILQDVAIRAISALPTWQDRGIPFAAWITTIACNLVRDHHKCGPGRFESCIIDTPDGEHRLPSQPSGVWHTMRQPPRPDDLVELAALTNAVADALNILTPGQQQVIRLRYFADLPNAEIAEHLGINVGAVKVREQRALRMLRRHLADWAPRADA